MKVRPFAPEDGPEICSWRYPAPYDIYDLPDYQTMQVRKLGFGSPEKAKQFLIFEEQGKIVGFVNLMDEKREVFLGIGVAPDRCGQGMGCQMLVQALEAAHRRFGDKPIYLEVRTWNTRAVACYERAGFVITGTIIDTTSIGKAEFYKMYYKGRS